MPRNSRCCRIRFDRLILFFLRDHSFPSRTVLAMTKRARALAYDIARRDSFDVSCSTTRDYFTFETTSAMLGRTTSTLPLLLLHRHSKRYHWSSIASRTLKICSILVKINLRSLSLSLIRSRWRRRMKRRKYRSSETWDQFVKLLIFYLDFDKNNFFDD